MKHWEKIDARGDGLVRDRRIGAAISIQRMIRRRTRTGLVTLLCLVPIAGCVAPIPTRHQGSAMMPSFDGRYVNAPTWNVVLSPAESHSLSLLSRNDGYLGASPDATSAWQRAERAANAPTLDNHKHLYLHRSPDRFLYFNHHQRKYNRGWAPGWDYGGRTNWR